MSRSLWSPRRKLPKKKKKVKKRLKNTGAVYIDRYTYLSIERERARNIYIFFLLIDNEAKKTLIQGHSLFFDAIFFFLLDIEKCILIYSDLTINGGRLKERVPVRKKREEIKMIIQLFRTASFLLLAGAAVAILHCLLVKKKKEETHRRPFFFQSKVATVF